MANDAVTRRPAFRAFLLIAGMALVDPLTHVWLAFAPPPGTVSTGLHLQDDCLFLNSMRMLATDFYSPYASCQADSGPHSPEWFRVPYYWMYAVVGLPGAFAGADMFLWLGLMNGAGMAVYLASVWWFLRCAVPRLAGRAFLLFALGGGLGGVLYLGAAALGLPAHPAFEDVFRRFAVYELLEGAYLHPHLHANRLYYTLPLAMGFAALALFMGALNRRAGWMSWAAMLGLLYLATFINQRLGPLVWLVALYWALQQRDSTVRTARALALLALPVVVASAHSWLFMAERFKEATAAYTAGSVWVSAFASAAFLHLPLVALLTMCEARRLPRWQALVLWPTVGYLAVFLVLYAGYQLYYGNVVVMRDVVVAVWASDKALAGAVAGLAVGLWRFRRAGGPTPESDAGWALLWLLTFIAAGISAFAGGRYLVLGPMKLLVMLGVPLAVVAAAALERLDVRVPRLARAWQAAIVALGLVSIAVAALHFQGPLGRHPGQGPFAEHHYDLMTAADAAALGALDDGFVLCPYGTPLFGDVAAERYGLRPVFGNGSALMGDHRLPAFREDVERFYAPDATDAYRRQFARTWCVTHVYFPDTDPVGEATLAAFERATWLEAVAREGRAVMYRVVSP